MNIQVRQWGDTKMHGWIMGAVFILLVIVAPSFLLLTTRAHSQTADVRLTLSIFPQLPGPNEAVVATLSGTSLDFDNSNIKWYLNGELKHEGLGGQTVGFYTGAPGSVTTIRALIVSPQKREFGISTTVRPADLTILWEGNSYVPSFYKGKALSPSFGVVTLTALPYFVNKEGSYIPPSDLVYTWRAQGVVLGKSSGLGKQKISLENGAVALNPLAVDLTVSTFDGVLQAHKQVQIPVSETKVIFYEKSPLGGVLYNRALAGSFKFTEEETTFYAEPFFFSLEDVFDGQLRYIWTINYRSVGVPVGSQTKELTLRKGSGGGNAFVSLKILNDNLPFRALQAAQGELQISL